MYSDREAHLNLPLTKKATETNIFADINHNLISIGQLCDDGCLATFSKTNVTVTKDDKTILQGKRDPNTKLWHLDVDFCEPHSINNVYQISTKPEMIQYLHAAAGYPSPVTWVKAILKGFYSSWPGLTAKAVIKHLPKSIQTAKGHLNQTRKNIRSTKREHKVYAALFDAQHQIAMDLTGRFPVISSRGYRYILVVVDGDSNAILVEPMKNRSDAEYIRAYETIHAYLTERGCKPELQRLDNEASKALKAKIRANDISYQLCPPDMHRTNPAEKAVQTFKNHFIAILAGTDPNFPLHLWCRLLKPAEKQLNMLRPTHANPNISAYNQLEGVFDYNATPLAPLGCKVLIHEKPDRRASWAAHGIEGWYIGPAMEHYRCHKIYVPATRKERTSDTVEFFPAYTKVPFANSAERAIIAAKELTEALTTDLPPTVTNFVGTEQLRAIHQLADIFRKYAKNIKPTIDLQPITEHATEKEIPAGQPRVVTPQKPPVRKSNKQPHVAQTRVAPSTAKPATPPSKEQPPGIGRHSLRSRAQRETEPTREVCFAVFDEESGKLLEYRHLKQHPKYKRTWEKSFANELGRLAQGIRDIDGTSTIFFVPFGQVPKDRKATYGRIVCELRHNKDEVERTRLTVGGNLIEYPGNTRTETSDIITFKLLVNSTISTKGARFICIDVKIFYLNTPMGRYEYMRLPIDLIPEEIIEKYNLRDLVHNGYVYCEIRKGMYGLPQAGILANDLLKERLAKHGYYPSQITPGLWHHEHRPTKFTLIVDDFGAKVEGKHGQHLIDTLRKYYTISVDETGSLYAGIGLKWDYDNREVSMGMPKYIPNTLQELNHEKPKRPTMAPSKYTAPVFGRESQKLPTIAEEPPNTPEQVKRIEKVAGRLLYYARGVDPTLLHGLNDIATAKTAASSDAATTHLLDYVATHPNAEIRYLASPMILHIHSDASYLTASKARSRAGGHFFLSSNKEKDAPYNGPVHSLAKIIKNVMTSTAESELGGLFMNCQEAVPIRNTLEELGHKQPPTPTRTDNATAHGIIHGTCKPQKTKSMDMQFHWLKCRRTQRQFKVYWAPGKTNLGDFYTKHHPVKYHRLLRPFILNCAKRILSDRQLQGCAETLTLTPKSRVSRGSRRP